MLFQTTEAHEAFRKKVRDFAEAEVKPYVIKMDKENLFPTDAVKKMGEIGLMGLPYETKYEGAGSDVLSYAIAVEELSRVDGGTGVILSAHTSLGTYPIAAYGTEEQKAKYLPDLCSGRKIGAFGLTEPNAGSDAGGTETTAVDKGDYWLLNGNKIFITNGGEADTYVVFAVTTPGKGTRGISAFIVERGWEGFTFGEHYDKMGIRSSATCELLFDNVRVPKENLLGEEGAGFKIAMSTLDGGRIGIAAQALGIAQGAYEAALEYSKERIQFGQPIAAQQAVAFKLADMATQLRAARFLIYSAAELKQAHASYGMEAAMAKQYASDVAHFVTDEALQIFGGTGYLKGMDVERFYRDSKITMIYEGTNEIQRVVIASKIIGKLAKAESARPAAKPQAAAPAPAAASAAAAATAPAAAAGPFQTDTGERLCRIFNEGSARERVDKLVAALKEEGHDFSVGIPIDTRIAEAERVVSMGKGIGPKENIKLIEDLCAAAGAAIGSSRPVAETLQYVPIDRYVGMSGQKFRGNLYIACGISGAIQHLKGIREASTIVAINIDPNAKIFQNCDYGIVGDIVEIAPLLTEALGTGEKKAAGEMVKMEKKAAAQEETPHKIWICNGCGYEYDESKGDPEQGIAPGTKFEDLPDSWSCPLCGEPKSNFVAIEM